MIALKPASLARMMRAFVTELLTKRALITSLSIRNFKAAYHGSIFGLTWVLVEPLLYVFLIWFFFTKAFRFQPAEGYPYVPWLMAAMAPWNFISTALSSVAGSFKNHAFLMKRPEFNMSVLPVVNILTAIYLHCIFLAILVVLLLLTGIPFTVFWLQCIYYLFAASVLLLGLGWITASLGLFTKDISNIVGVVLQIGFWVSPIFWSLNNFPAEYRVLLELNPASYILEGYRKSFIYAQPFWSDLPRLVYFWSVAIGTLVVGVITYKKLRPHFGDVI